MSVVLAYCQDAELQQAVDTILEFKEDVNARNANVWESLTFGLKFRKIPSFSVLEMAPMCY